MKKFESEEELVKACLKYNALAQRALYDRYVQAMYNTVYRYTCNHHDTQDILQEGFNKSFKHLNSFDREKGSLLSWIRRIHIHCALDFLKNKHRFIEDIDEIILSESYMPLMIEEFDAEYIFKFIEELNPRDRVIFNMHHIEGFSHEEIAEELSINVNSSRVYLARARKTLREKIIAFNGRLNFVQ